MSPLPSSSAGATMADLQSSPVEIVVSIFQYCDGVPEAVRLASTCRYLRACFESNILAILATVTPKSYIAFEDALHAVRATALIRNSQIRNYSSGGVTPPDPANPDTGPPDIPTNSTTTTATNAAPPQNPTSSTTPTLPLPIPPIPLHTLSSTHLSPTFTELGLVHNLEHLISCIDRLLHTPNNTFLETGSVRRPFLNMYSSWFSASFQKDNLRKVAATHYLLPEAAVWKYNFFSSMCRIIVVAAYLAGRYMEPWIPPTSTSSPEGGDESVETKDLDPRAKTLLDAYSKNQYDPMELSDGSQLKSDKMPDDLMEYLQQFPLYDFQKETTSETKLGEIFEPLWEYLLQRTADDNAEISTGGPGFLKQTNCRNLPPFQGGKFIVFRLLGAYEIFGRVFTNGDYSLRLGRRILGKTELGGRFKRAVRPPVPGYKQVTVDLVCFGLYQVEEVTIPRKLEDAGKEWFRINPLGTRNRESGGAGVREVVPTVDFLKMLDDLVLGGRMWLDRQPPDIRFFSYILRKHFDAGLPEILWDRWSGIPCEEYMLWVTKGTAFSAFGVEIDSWGWEDSDVEW